MNNSIRQRRIAKCDQYLFDKYKLLLSTDLTSWLSPQEVSGLIDVIRVRKVGGRTILFYQGDEGRHLFAVLRGRVQISTISAEGKEFILNILEPGDLFGEISIIDRKKRTATAMTLKATELLVIERRDFIPFLQQYPNVTFKMLTLLCARLRHSDLNLESTLFQNVPFRLAKKLLTLAETYGDELADGTIRIGIKLSQTQLGNMVGNTRESINKQLHIWEGKGYTSTQQGYIVIHDLKKLKSAGCMQ